MNKTSLTKKLIASPYLLWSAIFIVVPLIFVVYYSLTDASGAFSLEYIKDIGRYRDIMLNSIWLGFVATVISLVISYPLAYIMARSTATTAFIPGCIGLTLSFPALQAASLLPASEFSLSFTGFPVRSGRSRHPCGDTPSRLCPFRHC